MSGLASSRGAGPEHNDSDRDLAPESSVDIDYDTSSPLEQDSTPSEEPPLNAEQTTPELFVNVSEATCFEGVESTLDVMMPDRFVTSQV